MADEKKYSAQEAAIAVLAKAEEMLKNSALMKAENKSAPSNEMKPRIQEKPVERDNQDFETKPGHAAAGDHRQASQPAPGNNPKEQAEGNNPEWGTDPQVKGHIKLAHFLGHTSKKKKMAAAAPTDQVAPTESADPKMGKGIALS